MKIMIDCFKLIKGEGKSTGIVNVARRLVRSFVNTDNEIIIIVNKYNRDDFDFEGKGTIITVDEYLPRNKFDIIRWELFGVAGYAKKYNPELVIFPRGFCPLVSSKKYVPVIHDLIPFWYEKNYPGVLNRVENFYIRWRLAASAKNAERVVTVSEYSKNDIADTFGIDRDKIKVLYNKVDGDYDLGQMEDVSDTGDASKVSDNPYILALASKLPHKNTLGVVKAYEEYCNLVEEPLDLVLIGDLGDISCSSSKGRIIVKSFISNDQEFYRIIGDAKLFLFLSLIEGFGLPPIEAMLRGVPVICADTSCLGEVAEGAYMTEPCNAVKTGRKIKEVLENDEIRAKMIADGCRNAKKYVGDYTQEELCVFYIS